MLRPISKPFSPALVEKSPLAPLASLPDIDWVLDRFVPVGVLVPDGGEYLVQVKRKRVANVRPQQPVSLVFLEPVLCVVVEATERERERDQKSLSNVPRLLSPLPPRVPCSPECQTR